MNFKGRYHGQVGLEAFGKVCRLFSLRRSAVERYNRAIEPLKLSVESLAQIFVPHCVNFLSLTRHADKSRP